MLRGVHDATILSVHRSSPANLIAAVSATCPKEYPMPTPFRVVLGAIAAGALLVGCAHNQTAPQNRTVTKSAPSGATTAPAPARHTTERTRKAAAASAANATPTVSATLPERTGIAACDDYLASYLACHRAAKIYAPDQLQSRYEAMRTSLLRDSMDADIRPQLANRCNSLATQLRQALHGKACAPIPAPASSSP
jgi:hypothetical protein